MQMTKQEWINANDKARMNSPIELMQMDMQSNKQDETYHLTPTTCNDNT